MQRARGWANAAIVIALIATPVTVCVGFTQAAAVGLASVGGDCGAGCEQRHREQSAASNLLIYGGLIGGAVLMVGGIAGRFATRRPHRAEQDGEGAPELPRARVNRR